MGVSNLDENTFVANQSAKTRCGCCSKKKFLLKCSCSEMFCVTHISPGSHNCENILKKNTFSLESHKYLTVATGQFEKMKEKL